MINYYNISFSKAKSLELINIACNELAILSKPSIIHHKQTLQINISRSLQSIDRYLQRYFILDYSGLKCGYYTDSLGDFLKLFIQIKNCTFKFKNLHYIKILYGTCRNTRDWSKNNKKYFM